MQRLPRIVNLDGLEAFIKQAFAKHDLLSDAQLAQYADFVNAVATGM